MLEYVKSSDAKASKCHLNVSFKICISLTLLYFGSVISLELHRKGPIHCH